MVDTAGISESESSPGTRERLLDAAASLFAEKGYARTTTRELATVVGIQNASMYHHVRGKDELLRDLCIASLTRLKENGEAAIEGIDDPVRQLHALIISHIDTMLFDRDKHATMLSELRSLSPEARDEVVSLRDEYVALLAHAIATAQQAGAVRSNVLARHLTLALLNLLNWTIFWWRPDGELSSAELAEMLASLFLDGVLVTPPPQ